MLICYSILKKIAEYTNAESLRSGLTFQIDKQDLLAFIAVQLSRGVFCKGQ